MYSEIKGGLAVLNKNHALDKASALVKRTDDDRDQLSAKKVNVQNCLAFCPPGAMKDSDDADLKAFYNRFNPVLHKEALEEDKRRADAEHGTVELSAPPHKLNNTDLLALADAVEPYAIGLTYGAVKHANTMLGAKKGQGLVKLSAGDVMMAHTLDKLPFYGVIGNILEPKEEQE